MNYSIDWDGPGERDWEPRSREEIQRAYIRVCRDSGFRMSVAQAAQFTSRLLDLGGVDGALLVWIALGMDEMERIAAGTHPCLSNPQYATCKPEEGDGPNGSDVGEGGGSLGS